MGCGPAGQVKSCSHAFSRVAGHDRLTLNTCRHVGDTYHLLVTTSEDRDPLTLHDHHAIECPHCEQTALATVVGSIPQPDTGEQPPSVLQLLKCSYCADGVLVVQELYADGWDGPYRLWPPQNRPLSQAIPLALRSGHEEARRCFRVKAYTATAVMVRRTLEGLCIAHGVEERTLYKALSEMHSRDLIDKQLLEWAQELRTLGNQGAHYTTEKVSREDASDALELCEAMLDYLYVLTAKFNEFRMRRRGDPGQEA